MLQELRVKNFALIKDLRVKLDTGLNVITGETGAGKSLILKSLNLLMGGKAPSDIIGEFSKETLVEGLFNIKNRTDLKERLTNLSYFFEDDPHTLLVRRVISSGGKSKTFINGSLATVSDLREIVAPLVELTAKAEPLIELTNQHDNKNLQNTSYQRDLFDIFCKNLNLRDELSDLYSQLKQKEKEIENLNSNESERLQKIDFLNFQLAELDEFSPQPNEYESLKTQTKRREKLERFKETIFNSEGLLSSNDDSVISQLYSLAHNFQKIETAFPEVEKVLGHIADATNSIESAYADVKNLMSQFEDSDEDVSFSELEDRLKTFEHLFRKYNVDSNGLDEIYKNLSQQRDDLIKFDELKENLSLEYNQIKTQLEPKLKSLSLSRNKGLASFETMVNDNLKELNMKGLKFKVKLTPQNTSEFGNEEVSFWLSYASGDKQERTIKKTASGGELSRILLAIKGTLENEEAPRTYLFDEIDAGVSGPTAEKVGKKLKSLATGQQVITITHLPQVAALGDHHFVIEKTSGKTGHQTSLKRLSDTDRVKEVARLISGETITDLSLLHAKELTASRDL